MVWRGKLSLRSLAEASDHRNSPEPFWKLTRHALLGGRGRSLGFGVEVTVVKQACDTIWSLL